MDGETIRAAGLVLAGYLVGSIPFGVVVARLTGGRDPRTVGSGRTGGTNALRAMGPLWGVVVGVLDIAKGCLPVLLARLLDAGALVEALVGVAAVLGASRSIYLRFHGGRGVATGIGAMLVISPLVVLISAPIFFLVIGLSRYVSLGSLVGTAGAVAVLALLVVAGLSPPVTLVYGVAAAGLIWLAHADNIARLLRGEERKLSFAEERPR
ncbi:MAG TPA: glycerol-3-phosphate 1-O-acyltransferase PlsY [Candidatus Limnocylindrales bacterium]|jgi:glycerol-3-phosphate acyltransferase PlsY|nr:glycerol-3-phosphate 1-O-acyltransferase PlsY [Candidatus Limnocylindrales bacterium]